MMTAFKYFLFLLCSSVLVLGMAQKRQLKQAQKFENAGYYSNAAQVYREILYKDITNAEARTGLQRTSQNLLESSLSDFFIAHQKGEYDEAIATFDRSVLLKQELLYFNIDLNIPRHYYGYYDEDVLKSVDSKQGKSSTSDLQNQYQQGLDLITYEDFRNAFAVFSQVVEAGGYKDALKLREECREQGSVRLSILMDTTYFSLPLQDKFQSYVLSSLLSKKYPFFKVIDRGHLDRIIEEQKLTLSGLFDPGSAVAFGRMLGVEALLFTKVIDYQYQKPIVHKIDKMAYAKNRINTTSGSQNQYQPVMYEEKTANTSLNIALQYQLISVETGEILTSNIVTRYAEDQQHYNELTNTQIDIESLCPSKGTEVYTSGPIREEFLEKFRSRRSLKNRAELQLQLMQEISDDLAQTLINHVEML